MDEVIKYLMGVGGIHVELSENDLSVVNRMPAFLNGMYKFYTGKINGQPVLFLKWRPKDPTIAPGSLLKHESLIKQYWQEPIVFVFDSIPSYNKSRMTSLGINFIVLNSQIYLPELYIILSKTKKDKREEPIKKLSPSAQIVLLYYLYGNNNNYSLIEIQNKLNMPYPTVTKAVDLLRKLGLCDTLGYRNKSVHFDENKPQLLDKSLPFMASPVKTVVFSDTKPNNGFESGINALSEFTMINGNSEVKQVAISYGDYKKMDSFSKEDQFLPVHIEVWSYDPCLFSINGIVDKISLYLSLREESDERIQYELNNMIQQLW